MMVQVVVMMRSVLSSLSMLSLLVQLDKLINAKVKIMELLDSFDSLTNVSKEEYLSSSVHKLVETLSIDELKELFEQQLDAYKVAQRNINLTMVGLKKLMGKIYPEVSERKGIDIPHKKSGTDVPNNTPVDGLQSSKSDEPIKVEDVLNEEFIESATVFQISTSKLLSSAERIKSIIQSLE
jgi:hypothetical protein